VNATMPVLIDTDDGGAILAWRDGRNGNGDIYAQRIDEWGRQVWSPEGVAVCTADSSQYEPQIVGDMAGGAIITWYDKRNGDWDIYAQRVGAEGTVLWTTNGVPVSIPEGDQHYPLIVSDGAGGAIISWWDLRGSDYDVYAQRLSASGSPQWTTDGVEVCGAAYHQHLSAMVPDGSGGAVMTWQDYRDGSGYSDVYVQRVNEAGAALWTADGVALCVQPNSQWSTTLASDGEGGAVVTWYDYRATYSDVYSQYVNGEGATQWTANGLLISGATDDQKEPVSISDGAGGVIVAWLDERSGSPEIYAQRIDFAGSAQWTSDGVPVDVGAWTRFQVGVVSNGLGGAIVTWVGTQLATEDIYAQNLNTEGDVVWPEAALLCGAPGLQSDPEIVPDGAGGAIVTWRDRRGEEPNVYAQRVTRQGYWGLPAPSIVSVSDVAGDQGGQIWLEFEPSRLDTWQQAGVDYYSVWRDADPGEDELAAAGSAVLSSPSEAGPGMVKAAYYLSPHGSWQLIGTVDAHYLTTYAFLAETSRDSTGADPGLELYFVSAHGASGLDWWDSAPAEGYSVDNLSPCTPQGAAAEFAGGTSLWIHWNPNTEADLHHYAVFRGTSPDFVPDETNLLGTASDTSFADDGFGYGGEYYYKISAWDVHGNESPHALITPDMITGVPGEGHRYADALYQNAPNPFTKGTRIGFSLRKAGHVRLTIFDAKGRLIRVLMDEECTAEEHVREWDGTDSSGRRMASGTYFYKVEAPGWTDSKKMTLAK
jgi:hypothetical protein